MQRLFKSLRKNAKGFLAGVIMASIITTAIPVTAAVQDNLDSGISKIAEWLGINKTASRPADDAAFNNATLVEKINYLEGELDQVFQCASNGKKLLAETLELDTSGGVQTFEQLNAKAADAMTGTGAFNLFVYLPKADIGFDYTGKTVTLTTVDGLHSKTAKLKEDGDNYSVRMYFDFSGDCRLNWTAMNPKGEEFAMSEQIIITEAGTSFKMGSVGTRLRINLPKSIIAAGTNYANAPVTFVQDGKSVTEYLEDTGAEYIATIYTSSKSEIKINYDYIKADGTHVAISEPVAPVSGFQNYEIGINSMVPAEMDWRSIHKILQSGRAVNFGLVEGVTLRDGWLICTSSSDFLCILGTDYFVCDDYNYTGDGYYTWGEMGEMNGSGWENSKIRPARMKAWFNSYCGIAGMATDAGYPNANIKDDMVLGFFEETSAAVRKRGFPYWIDECCVYNGSTFDHYCQYVDANGNIQLCSTSSRWRYVPYITIK